MTEPTRSAGRDLGTKGVGGVGRAETGVGGSRPGAEEDTSRLLDDAMLVQVLLLVSN